MSQSLSFDGRGESPTAAAGTRANTKAAGRRAGFFYLAIIVFFVFGYVTITSLVAGGPARVAANQTLFALALTSSLAGLAAWAVLGALLYGLTAAAGRIAGLLLLVFVAGGVAMTAAAFLQLFPLIAAGDTGIGAAGFESAAQRYERLHLLAQVFSGLWLFPFGWLVVRSRIAPRVLGWCLIAGGFGYLGVFATAFAPGLDGMIAYRIVSAPLGVAAIAGEFGMCLWLLIRGARPAV